jgi:transposase InsO family protein
MMARSTSNRQPASDVIEAAVLAEEMTREVFTIHGIPQVVHADRGTSMTPKTVAALLTDLGVTRSHSRPRMSNDNLFSEALFKTLKYALVFLDRFGSLQHARTFIDEFTQYTTMTTTTPASGYTPPPTSTTASPGPPTSAAIGP